MARSTDLRMTTTKESFNCKLSPYRPSTVKSVADRCRKFPGGLRTKFYWRPDDYRTKLACDWIDNRRNPRSSCFPLTDLHTRRNGPLLYLCCPTVHGSSTGWTCLNFTSYECMPRTVYLLFLSLTAAGLVVFHCTVLSLRSHDPSSHHGNLDHDLDGELLSFSGWVWTG
jgi:hypothetical protein